MTQPEELLCTVCAGEDEHCPACGGSRYIVYEECPRLQVTNDIYRLIEAAELAKVGSWPEDGGWLSQTIACVQGVRAVWTEKALWEARAMKKASKP